MGVRLPSVTSVVAGNWSAIASVLRDAVTAIQQLAEGRSNASGTVTLTANDTTTTVSHPAIGSTAAIVLTPQSANAAGALATTYVSAQATGTYTLTHANAATLDRTFRWAATGG